MRSSARTPWAVGRFSIRSSQATVPGPPPQPPNVLIDPDSYAIYAKVLSALDLPNDGFLLQQETESLPAIDCGNKPISPDDPEWEIVESNLRRENTHVRVLRPFSMAGSRPFRLVSKATIEADDARLRLKYPGVAQHRPESIEYVAVSAVGFDWSRTKAIVYVRTRLSGAVFSSVPSCLRGPWPARPANTET